MNRRLPTGTPRPSSPQPHFISEEPEVVGSENTDDLLSKSSLRKLLIECYDECVYNDLPQYLVRISDMRLYNRAELWKIFRSLLDTVSVDLEKARRTMERDGEAELRKNCKVIRVFHIHAFRILIQVVTRRM